MLSLETAYSLQRSCIHAAWTGFTTTILVIDVCNFVIRGISIIICTVKPSKLPITTPGGMWWVLGGRLWEGDRQRIGREGRKIEGEKHDIRVGFAFRSWMRYTVS